jgi:hypothetical protein
MEMGMYGFVIIYTVLVFGPLVWGLGNEAPPPRQEWRDGGAMTADGVPYVAGPDSS